MYNGINNFSKEKERERMKKNFLSKVVVGLGVLLGFSGLALASSTDAEAAGMHRLYNPNSGEHFYTANTVERDKVKNAGWRYEGIGWNAPSSGDPVYRLYNPNAGDHHYTLHLYEKNHLVNVGWRYEGVGWYSDKSKAVPLYRAYNPNAKAGSHNYTVNNNEQQNLLRAGWRNEGIAWYGVNGNSGGSSGGNTGQQKLVWTVWFNAAHAEDKKYEIKEGAHTFNTEAEAKKWIDDYAKKVLIENGVSSPSYGYRQILK